MFKKIMNLITPPFILIFYRSIKKALQARKGYTKFRFNSKKPILLICKEESSFGFVDLLKKFKIQYIIGDKPKKGRINFINKEYDNLQFDKNFIFFTSDDFNESYLKSKFDNLSKSLKICCNSFSSLNLCTKLNLRNTILFPNNCVSNDFSSIFNSADDERTYYFMRLMLYLNVIDFDTFEKYVSGIVLIKSNNICMSLPESIDRRYIFKRNNHFDGCIFFPCLLNKIGWVGCALSYKLVATLCENTKFSHFIICEDDAIFKNEYYSSIKNIVNIAEKNSIDLVNAYSTWSNDNVDIKNNYSYCINNVYIARRKDTTGAVLNIYSKKFLKMIASYKYIKTQFRYSKYQMDQFTKKHSKHFNVFATSPCLVDHNISVNSTINKKKNSELKYNISASTHEVYLHYLIKEKYEIKR